MSKRRPVKRPTEDAALSRICRDKKSLPIMFVDKNIYRGFFGKQAVMSNSQILDKIKNPNLIDIPCPYGGGSGLSVKTGPMSIIQDITRYFDVEKIDYKLYELAY